VHLALHQLKVLVLKRQAPPLFAAGLLPSGDDALSRSVLRRQHRADAAAESHNLCACQRRNVHAVGCAHLFLRVPKGVAQREPAFGVCVADLDCLTAR
jgi:hypothetical protein